MDTQEEINISRTEISRENQMQEEILREEGIEDELKQGREAEIFLDIEENPRKNGQRRKRESGENSHESRISDESVPGIVSRGESIYERETSGRGGGSLIKGG